MALRLAGQEVDQGTDEGPAQGREDDDVGITHEAQRAAQSHKEEVAEAFNEGAEDDRAVPAANTDDDGQDQEPRLLRDVVAVVDPVEDAA